MKKVDLFILKSFIGPLIITFFIALFILLLQFIFTYIDDFVGKGLDYDIIAELLMYASARLVTTALPLAVLLASIMTFGNLGEKYELVALKSSGISLQKTMRGLMIFTVFIGLGSFVFSNNVIPIANLKFWALLNDIKNQRPELSIQEKIFYNEINNYSIRIGEKNRKTGELKDILIYDHSQGKGHHKMITAETGTMHVTSDDRYLILTLFNGRNYEEMKEDHYNFEKRTIPFRRDKFYRETIMLELTDFEFSRTDEKFYKDHHHMLTAGQLKGRIDSLENAFDKRKAQYKYNLKRGNYFKKEKKSSDFMKKIVSFQGYEHVLNRIGYIYRYSKKTDVDSLIEIDFHNSFKKQILSPSLYSGVKIYEIKKTKILLISFDLDSLLKSYPPIEQSKIYNQAGSNARSILQHSEHIKTDFEGRKGWIRRHEIELHRKFSLAAACLVLMLIGIPLGAIIRKGGFGWPVVVAILIFILYYILTITGEKMIKEGVLSTTLGMWYPSFLLAPLGIFLTYKAANDSVIFNTESWNDSFKKLFGGNKKKQNIFNLISVNRLKYSRVSNTEILNNISIFRNQIIDLRNTTFEKKSVPSIVSSMFNKVVFTKLHAINKSYFKILEPLIVKSFHNNLLQRRVKDFPIIEPEKYKTGVLNYFLVLVSIIIFPIGLYSIYKKNKAYRETRNKLDYIIENMDKVSAILDNSNENTNSNK